MKNFLIRDMEEDLFNEIKKRAKADSLSINKFILAALRTGTGLVSSERKRSQFTDLDELAGRWDEKEYRLMSKEIDRQRRIDKELWD